MTARNQRAWQGYGAAAWAILFAAAHAAWALGWRGGLTPDQARMADSNAWFPVYALAVVAVCALATLVALAAAQAQPPRRKRVARLVSVAAWAGSAVLLLRGIGSVAPALQALFNGRSLAWIFPWEPWFWLGAGLFVATTWRYHRLRRTAEEHAPPVIAGVN